ncbi:MAG TPA: hypothetical protein VK111_05220 [Virgibacillus sp.]|nr:hypothetical protein [Virgibacillus sp.]
MLESRLSIFSRHLYRHPATLTISVTPTIWPLRLPATLATSGHSDYISHSDYLATPTSDYSGYIGYSDYTDQSDYPATPNIPAILSTYGR